MSNLRGIAITPDGNTAWVAVYTAAWPITNLKTTPLWEPHYRVLAPSSIAITPDGNTGLGNRTYDCGAGSLADHES